MDAIEIYGAGWCSDCRRAKDFLTDRRIPYAWHDIDAEREGIEVVRRRNDGRVIIPTILFPDGSYLSEPSDEQLAERIGELVEGGFLTSDGRS
jgi:glutaredoxin